MPRESGASSNPETCIFIELLRVTGSPAFAGDDNIVSQRLETEHQNMAGRLDGKVAIVVGAGCVGPGWGNGRAMAVIFAREGARVFAVDRDADSMRETIERAREAGSEITSHLCDATDGSSVSAMVDACMKAHGRIDILVNNVGGSAAGGPVELAEDAWHRQLDYNLGTVFLACKHVLPVMVRQNGGAIVNISSASGIRFSGSPQVGYAASKAGVIQFSRVVAVQYAKHGIRVNTVIPGQLHTPMVEARLAKQRTGGDVEGLLKQRVARIPLGFMGDGRDTAHAALFLASDEARFITGTEIVVDGGMTARCD
jgi:NAD(P)-dependent dehydrogenase (short-subunit alcohol dehydrogenase family)